MKKFRWSAFLAFLFLSNLGFASQNLISGFNLTETDIVKYDASASGPTKTTAQNIVDQLFELGVRHINLSPRATMQGPWANELNLTTRPEDRSEERRRYLRLIKYIHEKGMTVGIRPIFFVVDVNGRTPYVERLADGSEKIWWHGNIQPTNPNQWFDSFKAYLDQYMVIAKVGAVEEFTLGAELYSMTVGLEDQWQAHPYGFPGRWLELLRYSKTKLPTGCRVMYDINFTDAQVGVGGGIQASGGEIERWRYRLVDLKDPSSPFWTDLVSFWTELDAIGIDLYRSLASRDQGLPEDYDSLFALLKQTSDRYAAQLDTALFEIESVVDQRKDVILKEVGFRSVERGFIDPFVYTGTDTKRLNLVHQAVAYDALLASFWSPGWDWFKGVIFWDASVDPSMHGPTDSGFSPLGKTKTEDVIKKYF